MTQSRTTERVERDKARTESRIACADCFRTMPHERKNGLCPRCTREAAAWETIEDLPTEGRPTQAVRTGR